MRAPLALVLGLMLVLVLVLGVMRMDVAFGRKQGLVYGELRQARAEIARLKKKLELEASINNAPAGFATADILHDSTGGGTLNSEARLAHWDTEFQNWEKGIDQGQERESSSGVGSTMQNTRNTVQTLHTVINERGITSMLDLPCGDWNWMSKAITEFPHVKYTGMDLAPTLVARNAKKFPAYDFAVHDIVLDVLPKKVDLVFNRDMLFHVPPAQGLKALRNIAASGSHYLLSTTFTKGTNQKIVIKAADGGGIWYRINLNEPPFNLPPALSMHAESEGQGKSMGLWDLRDPHVRAALGLSR